MSGEVELVGLEDVEKLFSEIAPRHARNLARATVHGIAGEAVKEIKHTVPVATGNLKKAIKPKRRKSSPTNPQSSVVITQGRSAKNDAFYWRFVEYGTKERAARPFIKPVVDQFNANIQSVFREQFGRKFEALLKREYKKKKNKK